MKLQYFGHLTQRANSLEKTLILGNIEDRRRREQQRTRWLESIANSMDVSLSKLWEIVKDREAWRPEVHGVTKSWTRLSDWATTSELRKNYIWTLIACSWVLILSPQHYATTVIIYKELEQNIKGLHILAS